MSGKPKAQLTTATGLDVYEAALGRIRWLFEEFNGDVAVSNSGGKDSTVTLELAAIVARERGELPLKVTWLDQECEFEGTVDYQRYLMNERDDIDFRWYQIPFRLFNATNHADPWLNVWGEGEEWVRPKEPNSIHENTFGIDRFGDLLSEINYQTAAAVLTGMRAEESPNRRMTLTSRAKYKWVTWASFAMRERGKRNQRFRFHPIYDWTYRDVWKSIHDNDWKYNVVYDHQYRYGVPTHQMRVSNYHHETALSSLGWLQEVEPETWEAATRRLQGISTYGQLQRDQYPGSLPYMFSNWDEYACYLIENLVPDEPGREKFYHHRSKLISNCGHLGDSQWARALANAVIGNDLWGTTVDNWINANKVKDATPELVGARGVRHARLQPKGKR